MHIGPTVIEALLKAFLELSLYFFLVNRVSSIYMQLDLNYNLGRLIVASNSNTLSLFSSIVVFNYKNI